MGDSFIEGNQLGIINEQLEYNFINCKWRTKKEKNEARKDFKITDKMVQEIRLSNKTTVELGKIYNVHAGYISRIKNNKIKNKIA